MSNIFMEILDAILENDNPEQAVLLFNDIISGYLKHQGTYHEEDTVCQQAFLQKHQP